MVGKDFTASVGVLVAVTFGVAAFSIEAPVVVIVVSTVVHEEAVSSRSP